MQTELGGLFSVLFRAGPAGDMAVGPRQPEPAGGEPAGPRDSQRLLFKSLFNSKLFGTVGCYSNLLKL